MSIKEQKDNVRNYLENSLDDLERMKLNTENHLIDLSFNIANMKETIRELDYIEENKYEE